MIDVESSGASRYAVTVDGGRPTRHEVILTPEAFRRLAGAEVGEAAVTPEALIAESFRFLLDREPADSILRRFELETIATYFPEWREWIAAWLAESR